MKLLAVLTKIDDFVTVGEKLVKEGGNVTMCVVVDRIKTESKEEGRAEGILELVRDGLISVQVAAERLGKTLEEIERGVKDLTKV